MNENCCLCICVTKFYIFCWLLVVSLVILIAVPFVFIRSVKHCLQEYSKCRAYQTLLKITHRLCWSVTLLMFIQTLDHSPHCKSENWMAVQVILAIFFNGLAKSPRVLRSSWILNECNLCCKIVKYYILSEVYMIKTVPHSTVSPQMWCINGIKGSFTRTQIL